MENQKYFYETQDELEIQRRSHEPGEQFNSSLAAPLIDMPGNDDSYAFWLTDNAPMQSAHNSAEFGVCNPSHALLPGSACWQLQAAVSNNGLAQHSFIESEVVLNIPEHLTPSLTQPGPNVQFADAGLALSLPLTESIQAVAMELPDGRFFCSQLGCDAVYLRAGDCRRHLKKHNGPFFPCTQYDCNMEFYRQDKLRAHLKQGHNIVAAAPRRGQRAANSSAYKVVKRGGTN